MTARTSTCGRGPVAVATTGLVLLLLVACADADDDAGRELPPPAETASPSDDALTSPDRPRSAAGAMITVADDGSTLRLHVGEMATLVLDAPVTADPSLTGDAVRLDAIVNVAESPVQEWEVHAVRPGTTELSAEDGRGRRLTVMIDVLLRPPLP